MVRNSKLFELTQIKNTFLFILFLLSIFSCEPRETENSHYKISFENNSNKNLYILRSSDTILTQYGTPDPRNNPKQKVLAHSINNDALRSNGAKPESWETMFKYYPKISVFVFDEQTLLNNDWQIIKENDMYLKRYDLSYDDVKNDNWTLKHTD